LSYNVEITEDIPYKAIYWHSESSTEILHYGSAVFVPAGQSSTQLRLSLKFFLPPLYASPQISEASLQSQTEEDLRRFLSALQAHEFPIPSLSQEDLPDNLPHPNLPSQPFKAEHKKGDSHKYYSPPPEE
ncbi:MAG: hypothetical protein GX640_03545, partial [Fibrobacter sp.]|nr:hypothetical protein [Fibrobacter sp.]